MDTEKASIASPTPSRALLMIKETSEFIVYLLKQSIGFLVSL
jgi:hypothetical protein